MNDLVRRIDDVIDGWDRDSANAIQSAEEIADYFGRAEIIRLLQDARNELVSRMQGNQP